MPTVSVKELKHVAYTAFYNAGVPEDEAHLIADLLVKANLAGHDSHGVINAPYYIKAIKKGRIKPGINPQIIEETATSAQINGGRGLGQVVLSYAAKVAIQKSETSPIALVTATNYSHCGQLGSYARMLSNEDRIGLALLGRRGGEGYIAPWGGSKGRFYINTLAIALPSNQPFTVLLDMATSVVPYGKVELKHARQEACPEGWIIDAQGNPSTDPRDLFNGGALLPLGGATAGHKGSGLAFMVGLLAATIAGAELEAEGALLIAINPQYFMPPTTFKEEVDRYVEFVHATPPAEGFDTVLVPGERSYLETQKRLKKGVFVEKETWEKLVSLAEGAQASG
jgi:uncharacterized oxidoreductase